MSEHHQHISHEQGCKQQQPQHVQQLPGNHRQRQHLLPGAQVSILANLVHKTSGRTQALRITAVVDSVLGPAEPLTRDPTVSCIPVKVRDVQYAGNAATDYLPLDPARVELRLDDPPSSSSHRVPRRKGYWWLLQRSPDDQQGTGLSSVVTGSSVSLARDAASTRVSSAAALKAKRKQAIEEEQVAMEEREQTQSSRQTCKKASSEHGYVAAVRKRQRLQAQPTLAEAAVLLAAAAAKSRTEISDEKSLPSCTPRTPPSTAHFRSFEVAQGSEQQEQLQDEQPQQHCCDLHAAHMTAGSPLASSEDHAAALHQIRADLPAVHTSTTVGHSPRWGPQAAADIHIKSSNVSWKGQQHPLEQAGWEAAVVASCTTDEQPWQEQQQQSAGGVSPARYEANTDVGPATAVAADALIHLFISSVINPHPVSRRSLAFKGNKPTEVGLAAEAAAVGAPGEGGKREQRRRKKLQQAVPYATGGQSAQQRQRSEAQRWQQVVVSKDKALSDRQQLAGTSAGSSVPLWFKQWHPKALQAHKAASGSASTSGPPQKHTRNPHRAEHQQRCSTDQDPYTQKQRHWQLRLQLSRAAAENAVDGLEAGPQQLQHWGRGSLPAEGQDSLLLPAWGSCKRRSSARRNWLHSRHLQGAVFWEALPAEVAASVAGAVAGRAALEAAGLLDAGAAAAFMVAAQALPEVQQWQTAQEQLAAGGSPLEGCCGTMLEGATSGSGGHSSRQAPNNSPHGQLSGCQAGDEGWSAGSPQELVQAATSPTEAVACQPVPAAALTSQLLQQQQRQPPELQSVGVSASGSADLDKRHAADSDPVAAAAATVQSAEVLPFPAPSPAEASVVLLVSMFHRVQQLTEYSEGMATELARLCQALDGSSSGQCPGSAARAAGEELCPAEQQVLLSRLASCQEQQQRLHQQLQQMAAVLTPYANLCSSSTAMRAAVLSATIQLKQLHHDVHEQLQQLVQAIGDLATAVLTAVAAPKPDEPEGSVAAADSVARADWVALLRRCLCAACNHLHKALELA